MCIRDRTSTEELVDALTQISTDQDIRERQIACGNKRVKQFSWARMAKETKAVYDKILES